MKKLGFLLPIIAVALMLSCGTSDEANYNGKWELITKPLRSYNYFWNLQDGIATIYTVDTAGTQIDTCTTGDYIAKNRTLTIAAPVDFCQWSTYDGEWDVHRHTDEFLTLIRYLPRGTIYLEFIKR